MHRSRIWWDAPDLASRGLGPVHRPAPSALSLLQLPGLPPLLLPKDAIATTGLRFPHQEEQALEKVLRKRLFQVAGLLTQHLQSRDSSETSLPHTPCFFLSDIRAASLLTKCQPATGVTRTIAPLVGAAESWVLQGGSD